MAISCPQCNYPVPAPSLEKGEFAPCPVCGVESLIRVFPAQFATPEFLPSPAAAEGEAACFDHSTKRAVTACSQCGRFLCALCATDFQGESWCPACLETGVRKKKVADLESSRILYDSLALSVATVPAMLIWPSLLSAPAALFVTLRYWKQPLGVGRGFRWRFVLAGLIAITQLLLWVWLIGYLALIYKRPQ